MSEILLIKLPHDWYERKVKGLRDFAQRKCNGVKKNRPTDQLTGFCNVAHKYSSLGQMELVLLHRYATVQTE